MALNRRLWLLALLTLLFLGALVRYRRAPSAIPAPPAPSPVIPPPVARPSPAPEKAVAEPEEESPEPPQPSRERGAGLKEKGESIFGGPR